MWWVRQIAVILCLTPGIALAAEKDAFGRYHALVIGNNAYIDLPKLKSAAGDAKAVAKILTADYGFKSQLLIDASRTDIIDALAALRARLKVNDNLLIYFRRPRWPAPRKLVQPGC
ncbi:MAG TPA: caspase family protein [Alphaproteobacteria bacterium]|jgi:hypothetical protein|nr:caspase family protein [Alphaproteobacteria bacterium]HJM49800.1 caspase family protein [Alphaproteobacteria bacterium]|tara:strand:- start:7 stop:354 length:348 start_codon:yes stop_codon:yes gene_type:complete